MYKEIGYSCALLATGYMSGKDMKERQIPVVTLLVCGVAAALYLAVGGKGSMEYIAQSIAPGMLLLLLSLCTKESIGYGDGLVVLLLGLWCGGFFTVVVVGIAFFLTGFYALFLLLKGSRQTIPFLPFLLIAMEVVFWYE